MKKSMPDWTNYWNDSTDLNNLLNAQDNIHEVYNEIRNSLKRVLMSEEMLEIQEALEQRIEELNRLNNSNQKRAA